MASSVPCANSACKCTISRQTVEQVAGEEDVAPEDVYCSDSCSTSGGGGGRCNCGHEACAG